MKRVYPKPLFLRGFARNLLSGVFLWVPFLVCLIAALCGVTVLFPMAFTLLLCLVVYAFAMERHMAQAYEKDDADPEFVARVDAVIRELYGTDDEDDP